MIVCFQYNELETGSVNFIIPTAGHNGKDIRIIDASTSLMKQVGVLICIAAWKIKQLHDTN